MNPRRIQTDTRLVEGGARAEALVTADGWNVNLHFDDGERQHTYAFSADSAELLIEDLRQAALAAARARATP